MVAGYDPKLLTPITDRLFVAALRAAQAKVLLRGPHNSHVEISLGGRLGEEALRGTRCYMNLEATSPQLGARLCPVAAVGHRVDRVNAYVSAPGQGTPLHFDVRSVCIVQLFGQKTWRVADAAAVPVPTHNCVFPADADMVRYGNCELPRPTGLCEHVLSPGDWLLVPRGVWHETLSVEGSVSASLAAPEGE